MVPPNMLLQAVLGAHFEVLCCCAAIGIHGTVRDTCMLLRAGAHFEVLCCYAAIGIHGTVRYMYVAMGSCKLYTLRFYVAMQR